MNVCNFLSPLTAGPANVTEVECSQLNCCWAPVVPDPTSRRVQLPGCYTGNAGDASYSLSRTRETGAARRLLCRSMYAID